jgi:hypothetical protein
MTTARPPIVTVACSSSIVRPGRRNSISTVSSDMGRRPRMVEPWEMSNGWPGGYIAQIQARVVQQRPGRATVWLPAPDAAARPWPGSGRCSRPATRCSSPRARPPPASPGSSPASTPPTGSPSASRRTGGPSPTSISPSICTGRLRCRFGQSQRPSGPTQCQDLLGRADGSAGVVQRGAGEAHAVRAPDDLGGCTARRKSWPGRPPATSPGSSPASTPPTGSPSASRRTVAHLPGLDLLRRGHRLGLAADDIGGDGAREVPGPGDESWPGRPPATSPGSSPASTPPTGSPSASRRTGGPSPTSISWAM